MVNKEEQTQHISSKHLGTQTRFKYICEVEGKKLFRKRK